jgi:hypothetical protein
MAGVFVGREDEVGRLTRGLDEALAGRGRLFVVSGEPGIGKTRLCDEISARAADRGARVAWGRCWEAGGAPAYWPWIQSLREMVGDEGISQALPELGADAALAADPMQARFRLFDAVAKLLVRESQRQPVLVILDDLHVADQPSLLLLQFVARALRGARMVVVATYRDAEARLAPETGQLLTKIARDGEHLTLARLTEGEVATLVSATCDAAEVHRLTEGNPLYVGEVLRLRRSHHGGAIPDGVRAAIRGHLANLTPATRTLMARASVLGRDLVAQEVALVCGCDAGAARAALEESVVAGVVTAHGGAHAFAHGLFREELYGELDAGERARLHWSIGERLAKSALDARAVHHLVEGVASGDGDRMLDAVRAAAERAVATLAFEDAVRLLERALAAVDASIPDAQRCELYLAIGEARIYGGEDARGKEACVRAAAIAGRLGDAELLARAALVYGTEITPIRRDETMVDLLRDALAALPERDSPLRARLLARLGAALIPSPTAADPEPNALAREGVAMARRTGDRAALLHALRWASAAQPFVQASEERHRALLEQAELAVALGKKVDAIPPLVLSVCQWLELGDVVSADQAMVALAARLAEFPQPHYQWRMPMVRAMRAVIEGRFDEAERHGAEVRANFDRLDGAQSSYLSLHLFGVEHARRDGELLEELRARLAARSAPAAMPFRTWLDAVAGRRAEVEAATRKYVAFMLAAAVPSVTGVFGDACVVAGLVDLAPILYDACKALVPNNRLMWGPAGGVCLGPIARTLGDLAAMLGRDAEAAAHFESALDLCEGIGARAYIAQVQLSHGALLAKRQDPTAAEMLRRAQATALACGMKNVAARAASLLAGVGGVAPPDPPPGASPMIAIDRDGELWRVTSERGVLRMKDAKGLHFLAHLVAHPHQEFHVSQLGARGEAELGDAGAVLDARSKEEYGRRVEDLRDAIEEATNMGDRARAARARAELDAIAAELARAVGLGGRDRKAASLTERARINVQRRIKDAIERIREQDATLGRYLEASVKTGTYCVYSPPWRGRDG